MDLLSFRMAVAGICFHFVTLSSLLALDTFLMVTVLMCRRVQLDSGNQRSDSFIKMGMECP